jgi:hypothetical protein
MDKLERYLDQVCRGIAGPRALRQHIRRELGEHLRDAAAEHEAAGMSAEEALERALEDFGGPEQVRAELEAQHGHRLMTVVIDKAMQWKEKTMKARWVWSTWAHAMVLVVIGLEVAFVYGCMVFIVPKFKEYGKDGWIDTAIQDEAGAINRWAFGFLGNMGGLCEWLPWIGLGLLVLWGLFESRVRSENKALMRLGGLGTIAAGMFVAAGFTAAALILPSVIALHPYAHSNTAREIARQAAAKIDAAAPMFEKEVAAGNWSLVVHRTRDLEGQFQKLRSSGVGAPLPWEAEAEGGGAQMEAALRAIRDARAAAEKEDKPALDKSVKEFEEAYGKLRGKGTAATQKQ